MTYAFQFSKNIRTVDYKFIKQVSLIWKMLSDVKSLAYFCFPHMFSYSNYCLTHQKLFLRIYHLRFNIYKRL